MTKRQLTATAGLLLLAMLLTVLIGVFDARRRVVAVEGNDLRTGQSAWVTATLDELRRARGTFEPGTKVFVDLEEVSAPLRSCRDGGQTFHCTTGTH